jgi:hypothetical protein
MPQSITAFFTLAQRFIRWVFSPRVDPCGVVSRVPDPHGSKRFRRPATITQILTQEEARDALMVIYGHSVAEDLMYDLRMHVTGHRGTFKTSIQFMEHDGGTIRLYVVASMPGRDGVNATQVYRPDPSGVWRRAGTLAWSDNPAQQSAYTPS